MRARARFGFKLALVFAIAVFALTGSTLFAQAGAPARRITAGTTLPSTCISSVVIRDIFYKSGSNAGLYVCTAANTWTLQSGTADVVGPASSTDSAIALFSGVTGKLLKNSLVIVNALGDVSLPNSRSLNIGDQSLTSINGIGFKFVDIDVGDVTFNQSGLSADRIYVWPDAAGTVALTTSNVATATALAADPTDCSAGQFATTIAASGNLTCAVPLAVGNCTLDGGATATCTATVPSGCTPVCSYNSASTPRTVSCAVSGTTLTAVSAVTLDTGVVNYHCY